MTKELLISDQNNKFCGFIDRHGVELCSGTRSCGHSTKMHVGPRLHQSWSNQFNRTSFNPSRTYIIDFF